MVTKFIITSDLHRGFSDRTSRIHDKWWTELPEFDALIVAGDIGTSRKHHFRGGLRWLRRSVGPDRPIFLVRGNHDWWDRSQRDLEALVDLHHEWFAEYDITYLENNPTVFNDVLLIGWDGWYSTHFPVTNDHLHLPDFVDNKPMSLWMAGRQQQAIQHALDALDNADENHRRILVSHFPLGGSDFNASAAPLQFIEGRIDVMIEGHTHYYRDVVSPGGTFRIINPGGTYDRPSHFLLEI